MHISLPSSLSFRLLHYGSFAVLCQLVALSFLILTAEPSVTLPVLAHKFVPLLEYPLMSLSLLLSGALLIDYALLS